MKKLTYCDGIASCEECLDSSCAWRRVDKICISSCCSTDSASNGCCSLLQSNFDGIMAADEICTVAENVEADADLCSSKSDCGFCVDTVLTDGTSTCQWFSNGDFCASGCGMDECGETTEVCESSGAMANVFFAFIWSTIVVAVSVV
jgi:hypothetical protein